MIHTGHAVFMSDLTDEYNARLHAGECRAMIVRVHDMRAGQHYALPRPDLAEGRAAFVIEGVEGNLFYHDSSETISYVPQDDIDHGVGTWVLLPPKVLH